VEPVDQDPSLSKHYQLGEEQSAELEKPVH